MLQGSETVIDNQVTIDILLVIRAMRVRVPHCELKWEMSVKMNLIIYLIEVRALIEEWLKSIIRDGYIVRRVNTRR